MRGCGARYDAESVEAAVGVSGQPGQPGNAHLSVQQLLDCTCYDCVTKPGPPYKSCNGPDSMWDSTNECVEPRADWVDI